VYFLESGLKVVVVGKEDVPSGKGRVLTSWVGSCLRLQKKFQIGILGTQV